MIFDPDGTTALCDDGRLAVPVKWCALDQYGMPTGEQVIIGWSDPNTPWLMEGGEKP